MLGVSMRSVGNWERDVRVPQNREGAIRALLNIESQDPAEPGSVRIDHVSDMELIAELARRLAQRGEQNSARTPATAAELGAIMANYEDPMTRLGRETKERLDRDQYRLAADAGQQGVEPDDLPNET